MNHGHFPVVDLLESVAAEWLRLANLCAEVIDLTEQGFTIDSLTLQKLRDAVKEPRFDHLTENAFTD